MPGPVSDSYDPEFGTGANAAEVSEAIAAVRDQVTEEVFKGDNNLKYILEVVRGKAGPRRSLHLTEREWRIVRFALNRALESI